MGLGGGLINIYKREKIVLKIYSQSSITGETKRLFGFNF